jgi:hypothetical protein
VETKKNFWTNLSENWERFVFSIVGLLLICYSLRLIYIEKIPDGTLVFGLGFLSFIYANVSRFKKFKGLGFEAELWEDKKKEAENLIERLKNVVSIYTREVILGKVTAGRLSSGADWKAHWKLYDDLVNQHNVLGQKIDFSGIKKTMDDYFLFDMCWPLVDGIRLTIEQGKTKASKKIDDEFGRPIKDHDAYSKRRASLHEIRSKIENPFDISTKENLAEYAKKIWLDAKTRLKSDFDVEIELNQEKLDRLEKISKLYERRPVQITPELIEWGNRKK